MSKRTNVEKRFLSLKEKLRNNYIILLINDLLRKNEDSLYQDLRIKEKDSDSSKPNLKTSKVMEELKIINTKELPELIHLLVIRFKNFWYGYEKVVCFIGIFTLFYTLILPVYLIINFSTLPPLVFPGKPTFIELLTIFLSFIFAFSIHEFSHAMSVILHGGKVEGVGFEIGDFIGSVVYASGKDFSANLKNLLFFNSVGIGSNFLMAFPFFFIGMLFNCKILLWIGTVNGIMAVFNAFPVPPFDGEKVYRTLLNSFKNELIKKILCIIPKSAVITWIIAFIVKILFF